VVPRQAAGYAAGYAAGHPAHGGPSGGYDELGMVAHTVLRYHAHLLTDFERKAIVAFDARWRIALAHDPEVMHHQLRAAGVFDTPGLGAVMSRGYETFCRDIAARVLFEHAGDLVLNRCPQCDRIVRTPGRGSASGVSTTGIEAVGVGASAGRIAVR
jgi:hypothetical protein